MASDERGWADAEVARLCFFGVLVLLTGAFCLRFLDVVENVSGSDSPSESSNDDSERVSSLSSTLDVSAACGVDA